jgi:4-nitrophenyl phosphatase
MAASGPPYRGLIVDMDGVLWRGDEPVPGIVGFFDLLRARGIAFVLATNNASKTVAEYQDKLAGFGVAVRPEEILTSSQATAAHLADLLPGGARVYAIGEAGLREALAEHGHILLSDEAEEADCVAVGWDRGLTWAKLRCACLLIRRGARFVGTNPDRTYPTPDGLVPGNGATLAALEAATGVAPLIVGKPEPLLYEQALKRLGTPRTETAALGDRLDTDIAGARRAGLPAILVLSGVTTADELAASPLQPDEVYADISALAEAWSVVPGS